MTRSWKVLPGLLLLGLASVPPAIGQDTGGSEIEALQKDIKALQAGQADIRRQLQEIKTLLQRQQAARPARPTNQPRDVEIDLASLPFKGDPDAPITIVEYADFQ